MNHSKLSESVWQQIVVAEAKRWGWDVANFAKVKVNSGKRTYWETPARIDGKGWPDLVLVRGGVIVFVECKTNKGSQSKEQKAWQKRLWDAGQDYLIWRPRAWKTIQKFLRPG
jgi:hypothetical protein